MVAKKKAKDETPGGAGAAGHEGGEEVSDELTQVVEYAAAIDVAKGFGMVCTRVPGARQGRRRQKVWRVEATYAEVTALMDHLRAEGIQRLVLESTSDYWRPTGFVDTYIMPLAPFPCQFRVHTRRVSDTPAPSESSDDCSTLPRIRTKPA